MSIVTKHGNELKHVTCLVTWRTVGKVSEPKGEPQVERLTLGVEVSEEEPDGPYASRYFAPWPEAVQMIEALHKTHQNFFEIMSIEPECSCLGPCRYTDRTRFWIKDDGVGFFPAALIDRDKDFERDGKRHHAPIAAGSFEDMNLLLERHRRSNHHQ